MIKKSHFLIVVFMLSLLILLVFLFLNHHWRLAKEEVLLDKSGLIELEIFLHNPVFSRNSVGNEWSFTSIVNGIDIQPNSSMTIESSSTGTLSFEACAVEEDKVPDKGCTSNQISVQSIDLMNGSSETFEVVVRENRGRYSGNEAVIPFRYDIKRVISKSDVWLLFSNRLMGRSEDHSIDVITESDSNENTGHDDNKSVELNKSTPESFYFYPEGGGNGYFEILPDQQVDVLVNEKIVFDLMVEYDGELKIYLNSELMSINPVATSENMLRVSFISNQGDNILTYDYHGKTYSYYFYAS